MYITGICVTFIDSIDFILLLLDYYVIRPILSYYIFDCPNPASGLQYLNKRIIYLNVARDHNVDFIISPLFIGVTSFVYIDVTLEELLSPSITNLKLPAVIRDAPFPEFDQSINQSV